MNPDNTLYHIRVLYGQKRPLDVMIGCAEHLFRFSDFCLESAITVESIGIVDRTKAGRIASNRTAAETNLLHRLMTSFNTWSTM